MADDVYEAFIVEQEKVDSLLTLTLTLGPILQLVKHLLLSSITLPRRPFVYVSIRPYAINHEIRPD